jgi:prophage antirepressor-like protein
MDLLQAFDYEGKEARTVRRDGECWWVAKDVCGVFGETNRNRAMQGLDGDEKGYTQIATHGGAQRLAIVNEAGLYALLFAMLPSKARGVTDAYVLGREAKLRQFKRWITHEVLPSIRKTDMYATREAREKLLQDPDFLISALEGIKAAWRQARRPHGNGCPCLRQRPARTNITLAQLPPCLTASASKIADDVCS